MKTITISLPDNYDLRKKGFNSNTMMNCDKCEFHTPDSAMYVRHMMNHIMEEEQPETLTTAP